MKWRQISILFFYAMIVVISIIFIILDSFGLAIRSLFSSPQIIEQFIFTVFFLTISLTSMLIISATLVSTHSNRSLNRNLHAILNNQPIKEVDNPELEKSLRSLSKKMRQMAIYLQEAENTVLKDREEVIKRERQRIARDLHDTVSQELFAASMIVSGLSASSDQLEADQLKMQLETVESLLNQSQNDLRIMLLHLRPMELEGRSLSEGISVLLKELTDKSGIKVHLREEIDQLPRTIEENIFRIVQEFISNTLKHAKAQHLEVYLIQNENQLQLKMVDDGIGFDLNEERQLSYGLKNIEDRVNDMAGEIKWLSAKGKGVQMDIKLPLMKGRKDDGED